VRDAPAAVAAQRVAAQRVAAQRVAAQREVALAGRWQGQGEAVRRALQETPVVRRL
jgi:hypothetical protein